MDKCHAFKTVFYVQWMERMPLQAGGWWSMFSCRGISISPKSHICERQKYAKMNQIMLAGDQACQHEAVCQTHDPNAETGDRRDWTPWTDARMSFSESTKLACANPLQCEV